MDRIFMLFWFAVVLKTSEACNGYSLKLNKYGNCIDDGVLSVEKGGTVVLDKDCNLILGGCLNTKAFKTAKGTYLVKKTPLPPMEGNFDLCTLMKDVKDPIVINILDMYGAPKKCPVAAKKFCGSPDKKISLAKYKNHIGMAAGTSKVKIEFEHDTGKSCLEVDVTISKVKKG